MAKYNYLTGWDLSDNTNFKNYPINDIGETDPNNQVVYDNNGIPRFASDFISPSTSSKNKSESNPKDLIGVKKPNLDLIPGAALVIEALAMKNGADKYGSFNWRDKKVQAMIYIGACLRHLYSWADGEDVAEDSGIDHLGHARACLGILIDARETGCLIDNRPKKGNTAELLKRYTKNA